MPHDKSLEILQKGASIDKAQKALIALHGRGGTSQDIMQLALSLTDAHFALFAPQAQNRVWYPQSFMSELAHNEPYLTRSLEAIDMLINTITPFIPYTHIYLMGFSQGACLALEYAASRPRRYGGIIAFIGGLIGKTLEPGKYQGDLAGTPVFIAGRTHDPFIPEERCVQSANLLKSMGANVTLNILPGNAHQVEPQELTWVRDHLC